VAVQVALEEIRTGLPFRLPGVDSDNGSEFIHWHLKRWCDREQIQLSRGRPYKKDDNAHIEQKNGTHGKKAAWAGSDMTHGPRWKPLMLCTGRSCGCG
jgi:transposase InsO family protein